MVTGGGSGIGRAVAIGLAREGYSVIVTGRRLEQLEGTVRAGEGLAGKLVAFVSDVSQQAEVRALFARARHETARLDLLFNNAGRFAPAVPLEELTLEQWQAAVNVNLTGTFLCTQEAFKMMKEQSPRGGRIINNGSVSALSPRPFSVAYTATKHAVTGLTKSTSLEGRRYDIACGQIDIGNAATEMTDLIAQGALQADGTTRPEPRIDLEHVVKAVVFMASLPLDTNVQFITLMATKMPLIGRG